MKLVQQTIIFTTLLCIITACGTSASNKSPTVIEPNAFRLADIITIPGLDQTFYDPIENLHLEVESAILIHADTNDILYDKNSEKPLPIASMSKIMSELLILEAIHNGKLDWKDEIEISDYANEISNHPGFASVYLNQNEVYTVEELFYAMAIRSANGATIALAEALSGSEKVFVQSMNDKAKQLGLSNSKFVNSTGLANHDLGDHFTVGDKNDVNLMSAKDVGRLASFVIETYPELLEISDQKDFDFHGETFQNSNWMLPGMENNFMTENVTFDGVNGLKTGFTDEAGYCFTGSVEIDGEYFISVVMGADDLPDRFLETKRLYETMEDNITE